MIIFAPNFKYNNNERITYTRGTTDQFQGCTCPYSQGHRGFKEKFQEKHTLFLEGNFPTTKAEVLALWDRATEILDREWKEVGDFTQPLTIYQMTFSFAQWILYFIENESHHRGQGYTYLRALQIEPPFFWGRESFK